MTTRQELNESFDSMAAKVLRVKSERDELLAVLKIIVEAEFGSWDAPKGTYWERAQKAIAKAEGRA